MFLLILFVEFLIFNFLKMLSSLLVLYYIDIFLLLSKGEISSSIE